MANSPENRNELAEWIGTGHLNTADSLGNVATRIIISDGDGEWHLPLYGGINIVDETDKTAMESGSVYSAYTPDNYTNRLGQFRYLVGHTGSDGVYREAQINTSASTFHPNKT